MASFPTSVKSFTNRSAGQTIASAHINDLQDEVNAIEAGYLQGSAPLNSSNSTVAALSVAGGSTFTSRPVMPPPEAVLVYMESTVTIGSSQGSTLSWTATAFETNSSLHSTASNPERLVPQSTGLYSISFQVTFNAASSGIRQVAIDDSTAQLAVVRVDNDGGVGALTVNGYKRVDALGTWFTARWLQTGPSTMSLSSGVSQTWFGMHKL